MNCPFICGVSHATAKLIVVNDCLFAAVINRGISTVSGLGANALIEQTSDCIVGVYDRSSLQDKYTYTHTRTHTLNG